MKQTVYYSFITPSKKFLKIICCEYISCEYAKKSFDSEVSKKKLYTYLPT